MAGQMRNSRWIEAASRRHPLLLLCFLSDLLYCIVLCMNCHFCAMYLPVLQYGLLFRCRYISLSHNSSFAVYRSSLLLIFCPKHHRSSRDNRCSWLFSLAYQYCCTARSFLVSRLWSYYRKHRKHSFLHCRRKLWQRVCYCRTGMSKRAFVHLCRLLSERADCRWYRMSCLFRCCLRCAVRLSDENRSRSYKYKSALLHRFVAIAQLRYCHHIAACCRSPVSLHIPSVLQICQYQGFPDYLYLSYGYECRNHNPVFEQMHQDSFVIIVPRHHTYLRKVEPMLFHQESKIWIFLFLPDHSCVSAVMLCFVRLSSVLLW